PLRLFSLLSSPRFHPRLSPHLGPLRFPYATLFRSGVVLSSERVRDHLVDTARTFVFDTGLAPASVGAARAALSVLRREPGRARRDRRSTRLNSSHVSRSYADTCLQKTRGRQRARLR